MSGIVREKRKKRREHALLSDAGPLGPILYFCAQPCRQVVVQ